MAQKKLGCLSTIGLLSVAVSAVAVLIAYLLTGNIMFSPGKLNEDTSGAVIGGVLSHGALTQQCYYCHPSPWDEIDQSDLCLDCHQEINKDLTDQLTLHGAASTIQDLDNCRACHTEHIGIQSNLTEYSGENFPHHLMSFSLRSHSGISWVREISCTDCHPESYLIFEDLSCSNCHGAFEKSILDVHVDDYGLECLSCHDGLESINLAYDHNQTDFPLLGQHQPITCDDCHSGTTSLSEFMSMPAFCRTCHIQVDVHEGFLGNLCEECHDPTGWTNAVYDHSQTGFILDGGHTRLSCADCHIDQTYQGADPNCLSCHQDDEPHQGVFGTDCTICHTTNNWSELLFDHTGPYAPLCSTCHQKESPTNHYQAQCSACHDISGWLPAFFSHSAINTSNCQSCHQKESPTNHYQAQCSACHNNSGWLPAFFSHSAINTSNCKSCHQQDRPSNHFADQCSTCHSTSRWKPANFKHTFPLNHEGANGVCSKCHVSNNYNNYTCYNCHEHSQSELRDEHEDISNIDNCVRCHWDGREHDDDHDDEDDDDD